jgi:hypothetical protein
MRNLHDIPVSLRRAFAGVKYNRDGTIKEYRLASKVSAVLGIARLTGLIQDSPLMASADELPLAAVQRIVEERSRREIDVTPRADLAQMEERPTHTNEFTSGYPNGKNTEPVDITALPDFPDEEDE